MMMCAAYRTRRTSTSRWLDLRGLRYHLRTWGSPEHLSAQRPPLLLLHGWMDVGASFQFVVDALTEDRFVVAPDWRGFGLTERPKTDSYWFPDYLGDLEFILDHVSGEGPVDLVGHSMGGNIAMIYAGVRPGRIRRLVNLEGFGMPQTRPESAPKRYGQWLDDLKSPERLARYESVQAVAARLRRTHPLLREEFANWLAPHWARQEADGQWAILGDPAHKRVNPVLYRKEEVLACWSKIAAPVMWVEGSLTDTGKWWGDRYPRADFESRLSVVPTLERHVLPDAAHMLHHDQPEALAALIEGFLAAG